jgi:hypothetical protein
MKRLLVAAVLFAACAHTQGGEFTISTEALPGYGIAIDFFSQAPDVVGFVGELQYQPAPGAPWMTEVIFAHRWTQTGGRLVLAIGEYSASYVVAKEVTGLGRDAFTFN